MVKGPIIDVYKLIATCAETGEDLPASRLGKYADARFRSRDGQQPWADAWRVACKIMASDPTIVVEDVCVGSWWMPRRRRK